MNSPAKSLNPWPIAIIGFFAVFITFIASYVVFAAAQKMDLVRPDYYEEEIQYQHHLKRLDQTGPIRGGVAITYSPTEQSILVSLPQGRGPSKVNGSVQFYRPSDARLDRELPLGLNADGTQLFDVKNLRPGLWKVRVNWRLEHGEFYFEQAVVIAPKSA